MSSETLFITGATGYIAGTFLTLFQVSHPTIQIRCLVRDASQAALFTSFYSSNVTPVVGSLSDTILLHTEASKASVVINGTGAQPELLKALIEGIALNPRNNSGTKSRRPAFIHVSGTSSVSHDVLGEKSPRVWSDVTDYDGILSLDDNRTQVKTDKIVRYLSTELNVRSIILSPPTILGHGLGVGKTETFQRLWYDALLENGAPFLLGNGKNVWSVVSVKDLGRAIGLLVDEILTGGDRLEFGHRGYYYVEAFEVSLLERAVAVGDRLVNEGKITNSKVELLSEDEIERRFGPFMSYLVGSSSRVKADRLRALGWKPADMDWRALVEEHGGQRC